MREPQTVQEHLAIPLRWSVYGPIRMFDVQPGPKPELIKPSYLTQMREENKIKIARRRNRAELRQLYRLREGR